MEDLIATFHIDWRLMLAQLINFAIVVWVLWKLAVKPLTAALDKRSHEVRESLKDAMRIKDELTALEHRKAAAVHAAKVEAQAILKQAEAEGERQRQETLARVRTEAEKVVAEARTRFAAEQDEAMQVMRREAARLVVAAVTKVVGKMPAGELDKKLAEEAVAEVSKRR